MLSARKVPKNASPQPAEPRFVDLTSGTIAATAPLEGAPGEPVLAPDGQLVYLLDRGKPSDNPD